MDVPIKRTHWFFAEMDRFYGLAQNNLNPHINNNEYNLETFKKYDLKTELELIKELLVKSKSPMVFTHNDFRSANIMVLEDNNNNNDLSDGQVVLCDFEYSSYGFRGHDFGYIISEWGRSMSDFAKPYTFPDDSVLLSLIDIYIKESVRILGKQYSDDKINSREQLLKEMKIFTLSGCLFMTVFMLTNDENAADSFELNKKVMMEICEVAYKGYWHIKDQLMEQHFFDNL
ncbi:unnamed protein product [Oppiella nova]|uniref:Uncharacterized protein n=1 Tax=Oppiella nova TaxID=334625 RepID=A0A7R9MJJ1_9ACAR|nr:unnamed protein product [Oppiella nova]CAG2177579.1 unnamed protein product [Oppiella nova]